MNNLIFFDEFSLKKGEAFRTVGDISGANEEVYDVEDYLGRGGNAAVFKCKVASTGDYAAIKFLINATRRNRQRFNREIALMEKVSHDHFINLIDSGDVKVVDRNKKRITIPFLVMELADCNLIDYLDSLESNIGYEIYAAQFRGLANALSMVHKHSIHRDIKPENILIAGDRWLLADCGLCSAVADIKSPDLSQDSKNLGPKFWLSPEAHNRRLGCKVEIDRSSDIFQLAAIFWFIETGKQPCGIITRDDWTGPDKLFDLLFKSLYHNGNKRPKNGEDFHNALCEALIS